MFIPSRLESIAKLPGKGLKPLVQTMENRLTNRYLFRATTFVVMVALLAACDSSTVAPPNLPTQPVTIPELPTQPSTLPELPTLGAPTDIGLLPTSTPPPIGRTPLQQGFGAQKGFWQVYFTAPTGSRNSATYVGGIDGQLADAIAATTRTLDIAAFEFNNVVLTQAVLDAHTRGVVVRMVVDDEHGLKDKATTIGQFVAAGIPVVDDARKALMHNKFMILDGLTVWTGAWNYSINDTYRNNNNALALRSRNAVQAYQAEFNKMFELRLFGSAKPATAKPLSSFTQDGIPIQILFAPEDRIVAALAVALSSAQKSIQFMAFSFTLDDVAGVMQQKADVGVSIQGIFETTGSETQTSELRPLLCSGLEVKQDGNPFVLHHKVFIIDGKTVIAGSFNFSAGARDENDENLIIITDPDLALQFQEEFSRRWAEAKVPTRVTCN
jgi:phosphatidylserine/phosphatidylglycerophosphate/cardiolipin synthase-like enzyme